MSETNKRIVLVSASPKVDQDWAVSAFLATRGEKQLESEHVCVTTIPVRKTLMHHQQTQAYETLQTADAIVFIFPLYFFCLPAMLTRFLQDFVAVYPTADQAVSVYGIINCGFPEPDINEEALRVLECFSTQTGRNFLGGVLIGCGGMLIGASQAPFMRETFAAIDSLFVRVRKDVLSDLPQESIIAQAAPKLPKFLYFVGGNAGWRAMARKNRLRPRDLKWQPYRE